MRRASTWVAIALVTVCSGLPASRVTVAQPGEGVWRNYDFVPGEKVWFASDFSEEPVGRFPASQLEFVSGNMQTVELNGEKVLELTSNGIFRVKLAEELPEDFTLEFTLMSGTPNMATRVFFAPAETAFTKLEGQYLTFNRQPGVYSKGQEVSTAARARGLADEFSEVKFQQDGEYAIVYVGSERVSNVPNANFPRSKAIEFRIGANARFPSYIKNIVVAVGLDDLYGNLMETGEFTTRGIFFDFNSAKLRGESTPVLEQIRSAMDKHPELAVIVEGHTDNVGEEAYNLELSGKRAQAVVAYLKAKGIDGSRMSAAGKGETEPVSDNKTPAGRAENRRVVLRVRSEK